MVLIGEMGITEVETIGTQEVGYVVTMIKNSVKGSNKIIEIFQMSKNMYTQHAMSKNIMKSMATHIAMYQLQDLTTLLGVNMSQQTTAKAQTVQAQEMGNRTK